MCMMPKKEIIKIKNKKIISLTLFLILRVSQSHPYTGGDFGHLKGNYNY